MSDEPGILELANQVWTDVETKFGCHWPMKGDPVPDDPDGLFDNEDDK